MEHRPLATDTERSDTLNQLLRRIQTRTAHAGVLGLGYVGLPLAVGLADVGFKVTGIDPNADKVNQILRGDSYILDVSATDLKRVLDTGRLTATTDFSILSEIDTISICVPTPLRKTKDPDISFVVAATDMVAQYKRRGQLVILESTTYPGTTQELIQPRLESDEMMIGRDVFLAFSPERVDPGNKVFHTVNTPKVIGGVTAACSQAAKELYSSFIDQVVLVSSPSAAEMVKLLENTFRGVNIGLVNEFAIMCDRLGLDVWEIIDAAATKPFGFMPFYPGPGLGGHCIPIDPHYLSWKMRSLNYQARFIELADAVNTAMPNYVVRKVVEGLNQMERALKNANVLLLGVTYKRDVSDTRESPAIAIIEALRRWGGNVRYHDPYCEHLTEVDPSLQSVPLTAKQLKASDAVVIIADHSCFDYQSIIDHAPLVVDTRNATKNVTPSAATIIRI